MEQLIKITSEPMRMVRFSQNARLVSSDNVDIERRKAVARQMSMRNSAGQGGISVEDIKRINHTFSKKQISPQTSGNPTPKQVVSRQSQPQAPVSAPSPEPAAADPVVASESVAEVITTSGTSSTPQIRDVSVESNASYHTQKGSFEMRVAKGELTYLPPMVMTIVTQRPEVHIEYLGDFNYVPPRNDDSGRDINLFT